jgi:drug/metabolite transporter (DMT)-like permease
VSLQPILVALLAPRVAGGSRPSDGRFAVALGVTAPPAVILEGFPVTWTGDLAISLAYLVLANSLVSVTLLLMLVRRNEASRVSALFFLVPPLAALIAWAILGESLPAVAWLGMLVAAAGVSIATGRASG